VVTSAVPPDTKDWTWVLQRPCPECGYDASAVPPEELGDAVRVTLAPWRAALARPHAAVRPRPDVWSVLEYGCHVRDVFRVFDGRLALLLEQDDPQFADWDQDATALAEGYHRQDPDAVQGELTAAGEAIAARFDAVPPTAWERPGRRSNGSVFTVRTLGLYFLHDVEHHLYDVRPA